MFRSKVTLLVNYDATGEQAWWVCQTKLGFDCRGKTLLVDRTRLCMSISRSHVTRNFFVLLCHAFGKAYVTHVFEFDNLKALNLTGLRLNLRPSKMTLVLSWREDSLQEQLPLRESFSLLVTVGALSNSLAI